MLFLQLFWCFAVLQSLQSDSRRLSKGSEGSRSLSKGSQEGSKRLSKSSQEVITYPAELPRPPLTPTAQTYIYQRSSSYTQLFPNEEYTYPCDPVLDSIEPVATLVGIPDGSPPPYTDSSSSAPSPVDQPKSRKLDDLVSRFNLLQKKNWIFVYLFFLDVYWKKTSKRTCVQNACITLLPRAPQKYISQLASQ